MPNRSSSRKARSGSKRSIRCANSGTPKRRHGIAMLHNPPIQAQSAGVHIVSPGCGKNSCVN